MSIRCVSINFLCVCVCVCVCVRARARVCVHVCLSTIDFDCLTGSRCIEILHISHSYVTGFAKTIQELKSNL